MASMSLVNIHSANGLSPAQSQAILQTNIGLSPILLPGTNLSEIYMEI